MKQALSKLRILATPEGWTGRTACFFSRCSSSGSPPMGTLASSCPSTGCFSGRLGSFSCTGAHGAVAVVETGARAALHLVSAVALLLRCGTFGTVLPVRRGFCISRHGLAGEPPGMRAF